jgi:hypothetical protein
MSASTFAKPSAWVPIAMSLAALVTVLGRIIVFGATREPDEGAAAHLFQLLIAGQLPVIAFFAIKWLQRTPKKALVVLVLQASAVIAALLPVWYFHL